MPGTDDHADPKYFVRTLYTVVEKLLEHRFVMLLALQSCTVKEKRRILEECKRIGMTCSAEIMADVKTLRAKAGSIVDGHSALAAHLRLHIDAVDTRCEYCQETISSDK